jgi:hypothetical protein
LTHLLQLLLYLQAILGGCDDAPLGNLLPVLVVKYHAHGMLEVFKFLRIDAFDLIVINFTILDQWEQNISGESLYLHIEPLCDLALLETFVDPSDMLPEGRVIIILNAIIGSIRITIA